MVDSFDIISPSYKEAAIDNAVSEADIFRAAVGDQPTPPERGFGG